MPSTLSRILKASEIESLNIWQWDDTVKFVAFFLKAEGWSKKAKKEEEKAYKRFVKFMGRFKQEGVTEEPGEENAEPENTVGGSGGAGTVANSKSAKDFDTMKKAIKENIGTEGLEKQQSKTAAGMDFKSMLVDQRKRK